jgi:hypothetical protein
MREPNASMVNLSASPNRLASWIYRARWWFYYSISKSLY